MTNLPEWMVPGALPESPALHLSPRARNPVRGALAAFARLLAENLTDNTLAAQPGLLQAIDARAKLLGLLALLVAVSLVHRLPGLLFVYAGCFALATLSRFPLRRYAGVWTMVPLVTALVMLPATCNLVTPGTSLCTLGHLGGKLLAITDNGLFVAGRLVLRTAVCVALAVLLTATTPSHRLLRGLRVLGVPKLFIMLLAMMERYLLVLVRVAEELHLGKLSRTVTPGSIRQQQAWVANGMGTLFRRTQRLGEEVYLAMLSRGYTGETYLLAAPRWRPRDWVFLAGIALAISLLVML